MGDPIGLASRITMLKISASTNGVPLGQLALASKIQKLKIPSPLYPSGAKA